jgi:hypothetical protein
MLFFLSHEEMEARTAGKVHLLAHGTNRKKETLNPHCYIQYVSPYIALPNGWTERKGLLTSQSEDD